VFQKTGIALFNVNTITADQIALSKEQSTLKTFPLLQPSPVQAVLAAWSMVTGHPLSDATGDDRSTEAPSPPHTPLAGPSSRPHYFDPALYTPSKCAGKVFNLLSQTSASFLAHPGMITSTNTIPAPVINQPPQDPENATLGQYPSPSFLGSAQNFTTRRLAYSLTVSISVSQVSESTGYLKGVIYVEGLAICPLDKFFY
jgi:hypothetical protein